MEMKYAYFSKTKNKMIKLLKTLSWNTKKADNKTNKIEDWKYYEKA